MGAPENVTFIPAGIIEGPISRSSPMLTAPESEPKPEAAGQSSTWPAAFSCALCPPVDQMVPKCRYQSKMPPSGVQRGAPEISKCAKSQLGGYPWKAERLYNAWSAAPFSNSQTASLCITVRQETGTLRIRTKIPVKNLGKPTSVQISMFESYLKVEDYCEFGFIIDGTVEHRPVKINPVNKLAEIR